MGAIEDELKRLAGKRVAVVCVGNALRGDDAFGTVVAAHLSGECVFDAGAVPENVLGKVAAARPEVVVFVDAADFGAPPGTLRMFGAAELGGADVSTHGASLSLSAEFLKGACGAETVLLACQAGRTAFGAPIGADVARAALEAARALRAVVGDQ